MENVCNFFKVKNTDADLILRRIRETKDHCACVIYLFHDILCTCQFLLARVPVLVPVWPVQFSLPLYRNKQ